MKKSWRMFLGILAFAIFLFLSFLFVYQAITIIEAHKTFDGYCHWRGLEIVNKTSDYGFCIDKSGREFKIILFKNRWYLDGDLPNEWPF